MRCTFCASFFFAINDLPLADLSCFARDFPGNWPKSKRIPDCATRRNHRSEFLDPPIKVNECVISLDSVSFCLGANSISISFFRSSADASERRFLCVGPRDKLLRTFGGERPKQAFVRFHYQCWWRFELTRNKSDRKAFYDGAKVRSQHVNWKP